MTRSTFREFELFQEMIFNFWVTLRVKNWDLFGTFFGQFGNF